MECQVEMKIQALLKLRLFSMMSYLNIQFSKGLCRSYPQPLVCCIIVLLFLQCCATSSVVFPTYHSFRILVFCFVVTCQTALHLCQLYRHNSIWQSWMSFSKAAKMLWKLKEFGICVGSEVNCWRADGIENLELVLQPTCLHCAHVQEDSKMLFN